MKHLIPIFKYPNWKQIVQQIKPKYPDGLPSLDFEGLVQYIKSGHAKNIIIVNGAGISTAANIPDFRTPGTGLYDNLQRYNLPYPEAIFDINYFPKHPEAFFLITPSLLPGAHKPTPAHFFAPLLNQHGILKKVLTQNIDGLDREAGLPPDKLVEAHGSFFTAHCIKCHKLYQLIDYKDQATGDVIHCTQMGCDGLVKPDIVFYGEDLPSSFDESLNNDFESCDLLIVIGTSLVVSPFNSTVGAVPPECPRVLINNEKVFWEKEKLFINPKTKEILSQNSPFFKFGHQTNSRDIFLQGDIQDIVKRIIEAIGWSDEWNNLMASQEFSG